MMGAPLVYSAIHAIAAELSQSGIPKTRTNAEGEYQYRSIDDILERISPLLAQYRLCLLSHALERSASVLGSASDPMTSVVVKVAYSLVSVEDGSSHVVATYGEAFDESDKATAKAMASAFKTAMVQTFCIPTGDTEGPVGKRRRPAAKLHGPQPEQGWEQWVIDIRDIIAVCESDDAVTLVQDRNRDLLKALSREDPDLYSELGKTFSARWNALKAKPVGTSIPKPRVGKRRAKSCTRVLQSA